MEGPGGPDAVHDLRVASQEGHQEGRVSLHGGQAAQDLDLGLVGHVRVLHQGRPGGLLGLLGRDGGPGLGGALTAGGGHVACLLGGDLLLTVAPRGHQAGQELPAQVLVNGQAHQGLPAGQEGLDGVDLLGGGGVGGRGPHQLELLVAAGGGRAGQVQDLAGGLGAGGGTHLGGQVEPQAGRDPGQEPLDHRGVLLHPQGRQGGVQVVLGRGLGVAHHVPGGGQDDGAGQGLGEGVHPLQAGGQGGLVQADLGVGEVVLVEHDDVGPPGAHELGHRRALPVHVQLHAPGAHQGGGAVGLPEAVGADGQAVGAQLSLIHI